MHISPTLRCFNEAAGIPRGRLGQASFPLRLGTGFNEAAGIPRGRREVEGGVRRVGHASMRPRVFPAEDLAGSTMRQPTDPASMRPRVFPAEDPLGPRSLTRPVPCFNEAAGIPRGRPARVAMV